MKDNFMKKLERLEAFVKENKHIEGCLYLGSLGKETYDMYSDYDIALIVSDKQVKHIRKTWKSIASLIGEFRFGYAETEEDFKIFVGKDYDKIDLEILDKKSLFPNVRYNFAKIIKDKNNILKNLKEKSRKLKTPNILISENEFKKRMLEVREGHFYVAKHCKRGLSFSARSELNNLGALLFKILSEIKGMEAHELIRKAEKSLSKTEKTLLKDATCMSETKEEIHRTMSANWKLMKYIEKLYEKRTKKRLNLYINDDEILKKIHSINQYSLV